MQKYRTPLFFSYKQMVSQGPRNRFMINHFTRESENLFFRPSQETVLKNNHFLLSVAPFSSPLRYLFSKKSFYASLLSYYWGHSQSSTPKYQLYHCRFEPKHAYLLRRYRTKRLLARLAYQNVFVSGFNYSFVSFRKLSPRQGYDFLYALAQKTRVKKVPSEITVSQTNLLSMIFSLHRSRSRAKKILQFIKHRKCLN